MKKLILILAVILAACSSDSDAVMDIQEVAVKKVTLNMDVLMASETSPIMMRKSACAFPELYKHDVPSIFNVYFVPTDYNSPYPVQEFTNVGTGRTTFDIPAIEYRVVVTNHTAKNRNELPVFSDVLYLYGENVVDFFTTDLVEVSVTNDYASIMVVNNTAITSAPQISGETFHNFGEYYNMYYRTNGEPVSQSVGINNYAHSVSEVFLPNNVYRYMLCPEGDLNIIVDTNILTLNYDKIIERTAD